MPKTIAVLSCAHIHTRNYLKRLAKESDITVVLWDDHPKRAERHGEPHGFETVGDLDELIAREDVAGFMICAENTRHAELIRKLAPRGVPIFCEKPLATTASDAREIVALEQEQNLVIQLGFHQRSGKEARTTKAVLDSGRLGRVLYGRIRNAHHAAYAGWFDKEDLAWFADGALAGGGGLMDMGCHAADMLIWHLGRVARVSAVLQDFPGKYTQVDQFGVMTLQFVSGAVGIVEGGWTLPRGTPKFAEYFGSEGYLGPKPGADGLWLITSAGGTSDPVEEVPKAPPEDADPPAETPISRFLGLVRGTAQTPTISARDAAHVTAVMAAAYESAANGTWAEVEEV